MHYAVWISFFPLTSESKYLGSASERYLLSLIINIYCSLITLRSSGNHFSAGVLRACAADIRDWVQRRIPRVITDRDKYFKIALRRVIFPRKISVNTLAYNIDKN